MADEKKSNDDSCKNGQKSENLPDIGDHFLVQRSDNSWHSAEIIQIRPNEQPGGGNSSFEYYVHYEGFNRRLDEWIELDRWIDLDLDELILILYVAGPNF